MIALATNALISRESHRQPLVELAAVEPQPVAVDLDEAKLRKTCAHCHQLPSPEVLPRDAWGDTIWHMFEQSGYGTIVKWPTEPEALVAWYQARAPEHFDFPGEAKAVAAASGLPFANPPLSIAGATSAAATSHILLRDLTGDDQPEWIVADMFNGQILVGASGPALPKLEAVAEVPYPAHVEVVDLDGDGRQDLVVASLGSFLAMDHNLGSVVWLRQLEDGSFDRQTIWDGLGRVADVQPDDFDQDGDVDLIVADFGWYSTGQVLLLENRTTAGGPLSFEPHQVDGLHGASHVDVADLDGDGRREIVALYSQEHEMVRSYVPLGSYIFGIHDLYRAPSPAWGFTGSQLVDLDADDDLDILLTNGDTFDNHVVKPYHGVQWLENQGNLQFAHHPLAPLPGAYRAEAADLDNDGDLDIAACSLITPESKQLEHLGGQPASLIWLEQTAPGQFTRHVLEIDRCHHPTLTLADRDQDGDVDLLVGNGQLHFTVVPSERGGVEVWDNGTLASRPAGPAEPGGEPEAAGLDSSSLPDDTSG